jgi:two-component system, response regulator PdtaR
MTDADSGDAVVVLVAEDETLVRLLASDILSEAGYRVLEARDGQEALTILEVHDDVRGLVTDVSMPNVDGLSLAAIVRKRWPRIGIVVASGAMPEGRKLDIPDYARLVPKPYSPDRLVAALEAAIANTADLAASAAPVALTSIPTLQAGQMHGAGGLAQPLPEPEE